MSKKFSPLLISIFTGVSFIAHPTSAKPPFNDKIFKEETQKIIKKKFYTLSSPKKTTFIPSYSFASRKLLRRYSTITDKKTTVANYLIRRLEELNVKHFFGVPSQSCSGFFAEALNSKRISPIITVNELESGYIADAYARYRGFAAVCNSYGVGTLSMVNATAGSLVEKVPLIVINGGPSQKDKDQEKQQGVLFTHSTGRVDSDYHIFQNVTAKSGILRTPEEAPHLIDDLISTSLSQIEPVYLEIPSDMWDKECSPPNGTLKKRSLESNQSSLERLIDLTVEKLKRSSKPALILGVEVVRKGLSPLVLELLDKTNLRFATTLLSKTVISETHPQFVGTYDSDLAPKAVRTDIEDSDGLISLGCQYGIDHSYLINKQYDNMIHVAFNKGRSGATHFDSVDLEEFMRKFIQRYENKEPKWLPQRKATYKARWPEALTLDKEVGVSHENIFKVLQSFINDKYTVVVDTCLASYPGADLKINHTNGYLANPIWLSIGYGAGATAGVYFSTGKRPLVVVGDGGFQMVAQTYSTLVKYKIPAILIVIDNALYGIEQFLIEPKFYLDPQYPPIEYNKLNAWNYEKFPEVFGGGLGIKARTVGELENALREASNTLDKPTIISVSVPQRDLPPENWEYLNREHKNY